MGKFTTGEKPKFDLITASKTKKYKIITAVILVVGLLMLGGGLLFRGLVTSAVAPNSLQIDMLSNLQGHNCTISKNQLFCLSTGTVEGRALSQAPADAQNMFVEALCNRHPSNNQALSRQEPRS